MRPFWPAGWQDAAWTTGAITRRRAIQSADGVLRLIFVCAWHDGSLRTTAAWARRGRVVLTDGSPIQRPGSPGTPGRLHAPWNLATGCWEQLALTDAHGAESLTRLRLRPHDGVLGDRNYAKPAALAHVIAQGADVVGRVGGEGGAVANSGRPPLVGPGCRADAARGGRCPRGAGAVSRAVADRMRLSAPETFAPPGRLARLRPATGPTVPVGQVAGAVLVDALEAPDPACFPTASRSARMSRAVWRMTPLIWNALRRAVPGVVSLADGQPGQRRWTDPLHDRPRLRMLQRDAIF